MSQSSIQFETLVLNELAKAWQHYVRAFKWDSSGISQPSLIITQAYISHMGQWASSSREMSFSRELVTNRPWNEVLEVLKHEMVHQYVDEILHVKDETAHGPTFYKVCKQHHIDAAARGTPGADQLSTTNHIVEKVQHLLTLGSKAGTEAESQAAITAAHNLMLKYNIELQAKNEERGYTLRYLGGVTGRIQEYMTRLANLVSKHYFVEIIWMSAYDPRTQKRGHELEVSGTTENVEAAEFVYDFLSRAAIDTWEKKFADPAFKLELQKQFAKSWHQSTGAPSTPRGFTISARSNFLAGFIQGFESQLKKVEEEENKAGLVLAKDPGLEEFYHYMHPTVRTLKNQGAYHNYGAKNMGFVEGSSLKMPLATKPNKQFIPLLNK